MSIVRAQVVHTHSSGLPKDNAVNTFHFRTAITDAHLTAIKTALANFFSVPVAAGGGASRSPDSFMSTLITGHRIKLYDVTAGASGPPILDQAGNAMDARNSNINLPSEVAVCLSFEGTPTAGLVQERRRGRIYLGPLNASASGATANSVARPAAILTETLRNAAVALSQIDFAGVEWVVYSRPYAGRAAVVRPGRTTLPAIAARAGSDVDITRVWVDDAFDTQRRRGDKATGRGAIVAVP